MFVFLITESPDSGAFLAHVRYLLSHQVTNCHLLKCGLRQIVTLFIFLIAGIVVH